MPDRTTSRFFLNALTPDDRRLAQPEPGMWKGDAVSFDFLSKYTGDIELNGQVSDTNIVHSVPSAFARPIQFYQAFSSPNPLRQAVVAQWRGLLATFALYQYFGLDMTVQRYAVPQLPEPPEGDLGPGGSDDLHLTTILRNQLPKQERDWDHWWLLYCDGQLIGATSPWSLVFTPAEYTTPASVLWRSDKGQLSDPIKYLAKKAGTQELSILARWVDDLLTQYRNNKWEMEDRLDEKAGAIKRELEAWQRDLTKFGSMSLRTELEDPVINEAPYRYFLRGCRALNLDRFAESDLMLKNSKEQRTLVFSREGVEAGMRVYGATFGDQVDTAALAGPRGPARWQTVTGREIPLPYLIAEDAFFPPKLAPVTLSGNSIQKGSENYALPLTPLFFEYFKAQDLKENPQLLTVSEQNGRLRARLKLPLTNGGKLQVEREYDLKTDVVQIDGGVPALAVWPDFFSPDWYSNFAVYSAPTDNAGNLLAAPLLDDGNTMTRTTIDGTQQTVRIWQTQQPAIGFSLYCNDAATAEEIPCGVVIRSALTAPSTPNDKVSWQVGLDFGTSSTTIMIRKPGEEPALLALEGRTTLLTQGDPVFSAGLIGRFYPAESVTSPFVTALAGSEASVFGADMLYTPRFFFNLDAVDRLVDNLKWGEQGGTHDERPMQEYLRSLVRYIACEARAAGVRTLEFEWSYPLALPKGVFNAMKSFWNRFDDVFCAATALSITAGKGIAESDAICRRLAWMNPPLLPIQADSLSITIDVGGGSTDIGFWTAKRLVGQVSVKLAGNDVLARQFCGADLLPKALWQACGGTWTPELLEYFKARPGIAFNKTLTSALDSRGRPFGSGSPRKHPLVLAMNSPGSPPWVYVRSLTYLFYMGVAFYAGLHARLWLANPANALLYFGGRGSSLLPWITNDADDLRQVIGKAFQEGLKQDPPGAIETLGIFGPPFDLNMPVPAKQEVAGGLLSKPVGGEAISLGDDKSVVVGEMQCKLDGVLMDFFKPLSPTDMAKVNLPASFDSSLIAVFLTVMRSNWRGLNLDENGLMRVRPQRDYVQEYMRRSGQDDGVLQPIFFSELKAAMDEYVRMVTSAMTLTA